ncbi:MAG: 6-phosphogluconolactonase [Cellvibrionaceae bacterium]|nr:6-phosphogluconolactonase [Cellvibrionaceae bacterium]
MTIDMTQAVSKAALDEQLVAFVSEQLQLALAARDCARLIVSGGSTPKGFFQALARVDVDWSKVVVSLADERCVPPTDALSNAQLVAQNLLTHKAQAANFVPLFVEQETLAACEQRLQQQLFRQQFDVVILGMGGDGHTASIFPEARERDQALDLNTDKVILKTDPVTVGPERLTQTRKVLLNTKNLILHITGDDKWQVFSDARTALNPRFPISYFIHQTQVPLKVFFTDGA